MRTAFNELAGGFHTIWTVIGICFMDNELYACGWDLLHSLSIEFFCRILTGRLSGYPRTIAVGG